MADNNNSGFFFNWQWSYGVFETILGNHFNITTAILSSAGKCDCGRRTGLTTKKRFNLRPGQFCRTTSYSAGLICVCNATPFKPSGDSCSLRPGSQPDYWTYGRIFVKYGTSPHSWYIICILQHATPKKSCDIADYDKLFSAFISCQPYFRAFGPPLTVKDHFVLYSFGNAGYQVSSISTAT